MAPPQEQVGPWGHQEHELVTQFLDHLGPVTDAASNHQQLLPLPLPLPLSLPLPKMAMAKALEGRRRRAKRPKPPQQVASLLDQPTIVRLDHERQLLEDQLQQLLRKRVNAMAWAHRELDKRLRAEQTNAQLRHLFDTQLQHMHALQLQIAGRLRRQRPALLPSLSTQLTARRRPLPTVEQWTTNIQGDDRNGGNSPTIQFASQKLQNPRRAQRHPHYRAKLRWLQRRLMISASNVDLVFQHRLFRVAPPMPTVRNVQACSCACSCPMSNPWSRQSQLLYGLGNRPGIYGEEIQGVAEFAGHVVTCFAAQTLLDLLWKCFLLSTKKIPIHTADMQRNVFKSFDTCVDNDWVHGTGQADLGRYQTAAKARGHGTVRKFLDMIVWEGMGQVNVLPRECECNAHNASEIHQDNSGMSKLPSKMEYTKTAWLRVEPLEDGRSVLHHVTHMRPIEPPPARGPKPIPCTSRTSQSQLQVFGELIQVVHDDMSCYFQALILEHLLQESFVPQASATGWPFDGVW